MSEAEQTLRIHTTASDEVMRELLGALVAENHPVQQFREVQLDLEETFMSITKSPAADFEPNNSKPVAAASLGEDGP